MGGPSLVATLGANISPFVSGLESAKGHAQRQGEGISSAFGNALNSKLSGIIGTAAIEETIRRTVEYGSKVNDLAIRLGISTDAVQQWDFALKQNGSSIDAAAGFFEKLAANRDKALKGNEAQIAAFQKLGITLDQLKNTRVEDIAKTIAKAFETGDPQALIGALKEVGGKGAGEMVTAFRDGLADALGEAPLISEENIAALDRAGDALAKLKAEFQSSIAPVVADITNAALGIIDFARQALAIPIGALMGMIDGYKKASAEGIAETKDNPLIPEWLGGFGGMAKHWLAGFKLGGPIKDMVEGAGEALGAVKQQQEDRDKAADERKAHLGKGHVTSLEEEEDAKAARKKHEDAERSLDERRAREMERVQKIHEQIAEIQRKAELQGMSATEKRAALEAEIAKRKTEVDPYGEATELEKAERQKIIAEREAELAGIERDQRKHEDSIVHKAVEGGGPLAASGGVFGTLSTTAELASIDVQRKSEAHLAAIRKYMQALARDGNGSSTDF